MKTLPLFAAAALALTASVAAAQNAPMQPMSPSPTPSTDSAAVNTSGTAMNPAPIVADTQVTTQADGSTVVSKLLTNGPVPDTRANRARYGRPLSNAGKRTAPAGN